MSFIYFRENNPPKEDLISMSQMQDAFGMSRKVARSTASKLKDAGYPVYRLINETKSSEWNAKYSTVFYSKSDVLALNPSSSGATMGPPPVATIGPQSGPPLEQPSKSLWSDAAINKLEDLYNRLLDEKEAKIEKIEGAFDRERGALEQVIAGLTNELSYFKNRAIKMEREVQRKEKEIQLLESETASIASLVPVDDRVSFTEGAPLPTFPTQ
jgi:hypothetical protein